MDTLDNMLEVVVLPANTGERQGARELFEKAKPQSWSQHLQVVWADEGFAGALPVPILSGKCCNGSVDGWRLYPSIQTARAQRFRGVATPVAR